MIPNPLVSVKLFSYGYDLTFFGILEIELSTMLEVPSGATQYKATDVQGNFELEFKGPNWVKDLGTGKADNSLISCKSINGLVPSKT